MHAFWAQQLILPDVDLNPSVQSKHCGKMVNWHLCTNHMHEPTQCLINDLCDPVEPTLYSVHFDSGPKHVLLEVCLLEETVKGILIWLSELPQLLSRLPQDLRARVLETGHPLAGCPSAWSDVLIWGQLSSHEKSSLEITNTSLNPLLKEGYKESLILSGKNS